MKRSFLIYALFFICSVVQAQWECASDGTTGDLTSRQGVKGTEQENFIFDYLGNYLRLYTDDGTEVYSAEYDTWGRQTAKSISSSLPSSLNSFSFHRGYTGHEMLPAFGLINMNGRLYDPAIARFLSPDNYVQLPDNAQNFNRYSYCLNNPLKYVDPSGEAF